MAITQTLTTELEAVNQMLEIIGERPVNDLSGTVLNAALVAQQRLHYTNRAVQSQGWPNNFDTEYELIPDGSSNIVIPSNALSVDPSDARKDYVVRNGKLYDREEQTFIFTDNVKVDIVWFFPYDELPEILRNYIYIVAGRQFQARYIGAQELHVLTHDDEQKALSQVRKWKMKVNDKSIFNNTPVARISRRMYNPVRS